GAVGNRVVASIDVSMAGSALWVFTNGTWEQTAGTLSETSGSQTIAATGALVLSGSGSFNMVIAGSLTVTGSLTVNTSGTFMIGSGNNSVTVGSSTSLATFTSGTVTVYGRLTITNGTTTINGASILIKQQSTNLLSGTSNGFECSGGNLTFTSGSVTMVDPNGGTGGVTGRDVKLTTAGTVNLTGSTIILGDGVSTLPTSQGKAGYYISATIPLYNLIIQGGGVAGRNDSLASSITVNGTLTMLSSGFVASGASAVTYGGSSTLLYNGTTQQTTGLELSPTVNNLTTNNSAGVVLSSATTVNGVLTLAAGLLDNSTHQITLGPSGSVVNAGGSISQAPLPVELTSFTAFPRTNGVELSWKTATEINNYGFDVERKSTDSWSKIGFVSGNGTSNIAHNYSYSDNAPAGTYSYRLKQIDRDGKFQYSAVVEATVGITPNTMILGQNYPNPFNPETSIEFAVPATGHTTLKVYNMLGQEIATLVNGNIEAGVLNRVSFKGSNFPSGMYFYTLRSGNFVDTKKMLMVK
ncbi:MAG TPA: T9SS type A sorting domain-containing protein, partial [Bacteroidota bacterium]|nr:T9SS type A sorting domain-containing protein [Bacteroidota bacterium]